MSDGKGTSKGEQRRQLIMQAAAEILAEHGFGGISHRSVARRAGVPLSATTYYFVSLDELVATGVEVLAQDWLARSRRILTVSGQARLSRRDLANLIIRIVTLTPDYELLEPAGVATLYERYVEAARHERLRPAIKGFNDEVDSLLAQALSRGQVKQPQKVAPLVLAYIDGAVLRSLAEGSELQDVENGLIRFLQKIA